MKRTLPFIIVVVALSFLGGKCTEDRQRPVSVQEPSAGVIVETGPMGDCAHDYYPLVTGYSVRYRTTSGGTTMEYTMNVTDVDDESAVTEFVFAQSRDIPQEMRFTQELACSDGNLVPQGYLDMSSAFGDVRMVMETDDVEGEMLPGDLTVGRSWSTSYELTVTPEAGSFPMAQFGPMKSTVSIENTVEGSETVEVPAGKFEALKVKSVTTTVTEIPNLPGNIPPTETQATSYQWFVRGVGPVKMESNDGAFVTEAVAVDMP